MRVRLWGARGSVPTPEPANSGYGGNTSCVELRAADGQRLVLDGGSGLYHLGSQWAQERFGKGGGEAHLLITHTHWDHIQGIPFFAPLLTAGNHFIFYGDSALKAALQRQGHPRCCPVPDFFEKDIGARVEVRALEEGEFHLGATAVRVRRLNHVPGLACLGYRLEEGGAALAYLPDVEYLEEAHRRPALELAREVDLLIHDAYFTAAEYPRHRGRGHASDHDALHIARAAGARRLLLFHHHPERSDTQIDALAAAHAKEKIPVEAAREGDEYLFG